VHSTDESIQKKLRTMNGSHVEVTGTAFASHTAHHHAPLVADIRDVESE
jgi:hypothetical protein